jgi:hypothetical protein
MVADFCLVVTSSWRQNVTIKWRQKYKFSFWRPVFIVSSLLRVGALQTKTRKHENAKKFDDENAKEQKPQKTRRKDEHTKIPRRMRGDTMTKTRRHGDKIAIIIDFNLLRFRVFDSCLGFFVIIRSRFRVFFFVPSCFRLFEFHIFSSHCPKFGTRWTHE